MTYSVWQTETKTWTGFRIKIGQMEYGLNIKRTVIPS